MNPNEITALTQRGYELFGRGDFPALLDLCADDIEWVMPEIEGVPYAGTWSGKEGLMQFFAAFDAAIRTTRFEPREMIAQGDKVIVLGYFAGEAKPTGRTFENEWVNIHTYNQDGKLARFQQFTNTTVTQAAFSPVAAQSQSTQAPMHH